jgi:aspartokinase
VENLTKKPVQKGTIVVALSRITKNLSKVSTPLKPNIDIEDLRMRSSLCSLTFKKTLDIQRKIAVLHPFQISQDDLFSLTEGPKQVTLVIAQSTKEKIIIEFATKPMAEFDDLVAITIQFNPKQDNTPNIYYSLFSTMAAKRINILEIISTSTEISFLVKKVDMEETIESLNTHFSK